MSGVSRHLHDGQVALALPCRNEPARAHAAPSQLSWGPLSNRTNAAIFLGYHSVHPDGPPFLSVTPERFEEHLRILRSRGYRSGREADLDGLVEGRRPPAPLAFITFDDGFLDNYTHAWPLLQQYGFGAMTFIIPPLVDAPALQWSGLLADSRQWPEVLRPLRWEHVDAMAAGGAEFGSHTMSHARLTEAGDEQLTQELLDSRRAVAARLGACRTLAYPFGAWTPRVASAVRAAGYSYAFGLGPDSRRSVSPHSIPRVPIDHRDDARRFAGKLRPELRTLYLSPTLRAIRVRARELRATG